MFFRFYLILNKSTPLWKGLGLLWRGLRLEVLTALFEVFGGNYLVFEHHLLDFIDLEGSIGSFFGVEG